VKTILKYSGLFLSSPLSSPPIRRAGLLCSPEHSGSREREFTPSLALPRSFLTGEGINPLPSPPPFVPHGRGN